MADKRSCLVRLTGTRMSQKSDANSYPDGYRVLNSCELRELLQDEDKMNQIVRLSEKFQELQMDRDTLLVTNRSLAEDSLTRRPHLQNGKLQLAAKYEELATLSTACREKQSRLEAFTEKHSPQTAHNLLQEEVTRAEEQSEVISKPLASFMSPKTLSVSFHLGPRPPCIKRQQKRSHILTCCFQPYSQDRGLFRHFVE